MDYKFEVTEELVQPVLSIRTRTAIVNLPQEISKAYNAISQYISQIGEQASAAPFVAYYNMDMDDLDIEMGFPVAKVIAGKGEIKQSEIPAGKRVSTIYQGPYSEIEQAYQAMMQWINKNDYSPTGVAYEFYYNSPLEVPESELLTKITFLLK